MPVEEMAGCWGAGATVAIEPVIEAGPTVVGGVRSSLGPVLALSVGGGLTIFRLLIS